MANMHKNSRNLMAQVRDGRFDGDNERPMFGRKRHKAHKQTDGDRKGTPKFGVRDFVGK